MFRFLDLLSVPRTSNHRRGRGTAAGMVGVLLYGLIIAVAGILGDLSESLLKRGMQCKDSSNWLPGLGSILDILDSVLAAAPPAFVCWAAGIV